MFQQTSGRPSHPQTIAANFIFKQESTAKQAIPARWIKTEN
ncbi:MAG: hypothetical protein WA254_03650 [Candidatus Sulfotelmatobacter sp.]